MVAATKHPYQPLPGLELVAQGKVCEIYALPRNDLLLLDASDRFSTHNVVHQTPVPTKGQYITALTLYWLPDFAEVGLKTHIVACGRDIYRYLNPHEDYPEDLHLRAIVVRRQSVSPHEFIWRSYFAGSYWKGYAEGWPEHDGRDPYGYNLEPVPPLMHRFKEPLFTPTEKSADDDPEDYRSILVSCPLPHRATEAGYRLLSARLEAKGITLIDHKFECSAMGEIVDYWGNGDCSRMAWTKDVCEGVEPPWLDKEVGRQLAVKKWDGGPKVPLAFEDDEVKEIIAPYAVAFEAITGQTLADFQRSTLG